MGINTITANDTLTLFDRVFTDFASGDTSVITFGSDFVTMKSGKNGNAIYSRNADGDNATAVIRLMRGSSDDRFLQARLSQIEGDFASTVLAKGEFVKRLGDGQGNVVSDVYTLEGGVFTRKVDGKENVDGDTEQGVSIYNMKFSVGKRIIR